MLHMDGVEKVNPCRIMHDGGCSQTINAVHAPLLCGSSVIVCTFVEDTWMPPLVQALRSSGAKLKELKSSAPASTTLRSLLELVGDSLEVLDLTESFMEGDIWLQDIASWLQRGPRALRVIKVNGDPDTATPGDALVALGPGSGGGDEGAVVTPLLVPSLETLYLHGIILEGPPQ